MGKKDDAPKRPQSAYMLWLNANRDKAKQQNSDKSQAELLKILGAEWKDIPADERVKWEAKAQVARQEYQKLKQDYDLKRKDAPESDEDSDDGKKKKKKRTKKDKNAPKRAASAYMLWLNANRERIKAENPGIKMTDIAKRGGEQWKLVSADEKAKYESQASKLKEQYTEQMTQYRALNPKGKATSSKKASKSSSSSKKAAPKSAPKGKAEEEEEDDDEEEEEEEEDDDEDEDEDDDDEDDN